MPVLRACPKHEKACADAALLGVTGIDATTGGERGYVGNMLATTTPAIRIEVPEDQLV